MFLIIQTGDPVTSAKQKFGAFDQWFSDGLRIKPEQAQVINVHKGDQLPDANAAIDDISGIVITGSPAMVTDQDDWLLSTQNWLTKIIANDTPILGVCYGHQLLADMLGGRVGYNPKGRNLGLSRMTFTESAKHDELLSHFAEQTNMPTFVSHLQSVLELPKSAVRLGHCELDQNHAFRSENVVWGLQFHPEWNVEITQEYINARKEDIEKEGLNPQKMSSQLKPCEEAHSLLERFKNIAQAHSR